MLLFLVMINSFCKASCRISNILQMAVPSWRAIRSISSYSRIFPLYTIERLDKQCILTVSLPILQEFTVTFRMSQKWTLYLTAKNPIKCNKCTFKQPNKRDETNIAHVDLTYHQLLFEKRMWKRSGWYCWGSYFAKRRRKKMMMLSNYNVWEQRLLLGKNARQK